MCAGMLGEEDLGLEESMGPGLRIDLLSRRITKRVGIWLREPFLKGIASFVFPGDVLTSTGRFDVTLIKTKDGTPLLFSNIVFPPKCPLQHVDSVLKWSIKTYCIAVKCFSFFFLYCLNVQLLVWTSAFLVPVDEKKLSNYTVHSDHPVKHFSVSNHHNQNNVGIVLLLL